MDFLAEFEQKLQKLRMNREKVPEELLKTKYAKAYNALLEDIKADARELASKIMTTGCRFLEADWPEYKDQFLRDTQAIIDQETEKGTIKKYSRAIFREYDLNKAMDIMAEASERIHTEAYRPYWNAHCRKEGSVITNDLIEMQWDEKTGTWIRETKDGWSFTLMLPPPEEMR